MGYVEGPIEDIVDVGILINHEYVPLDEIFQVHATIKNIDLFGQDLLPGRLHFCHFITIPRYETLTSEINIKIRSHTEEVKLHLGKLNLVETIRQAYESVVPRQVAICMATYNPDIHLFEQQIDSIINQTFKSWHLFIQDDCSDEEIWNQILDITTNHDQITVTRNDHTLGFFHNFERCLMRVSHEFDFVALADQDDHWRLDKLEQLYSHIDSAELIYGDMAIVDVDGRFISDTFWTERSNHYHSLATLFISNTVTGSASLFKRSLLKHVLPFPAKMGNSFHDHWIAQVSACLSGLRYLDDTVQSYIQHERNVTGYEAFDRPQLSDSTLTLISLQRLKVAISTSGGKKRKKKFQFNNLKVYFDNYLRRKLHYLIIRERMPYAINRRLDSIFGLSNGTIKELLKLHIEVYQNGWRTNNQELSYIKAIEVMKILSMPYRRTVQD